MPSDARRIPRALVRSIHDGVPVCGFTGVNGAGKTLIATNCAIADLARGRKVYSTVPIKSKWGESEPILSLRQLLTLENATLFLDEIAVIFSSRSTSSLPADVVALLQTLRHRRLTVLWTAPEWMRADNQLRGVTQGVVNVMPQLRRRDPGTPWPAPRVVFAGLLDTSTGKADAMPTRVLRRRMYFPTRLPAWGAYDTHADTPMLGRHLQTGTCVDCGGSQERPKHSKQRHEMLGIPYYAESAGFHAPRVVMTDAPVAVKVTEIDEPPA